MRQHRIAHAPRRKARLPRTESRPLVHQHRRSLLTALALLLVAVTAQAQDDETWDQPFREPLYLVHITETATSTGPVEKDVYILHPTQPEDGVVLTADGYGGWFINKAELAGGSFNTRRRVCEGMRGIPREKLSLGFSCDALWGCEQVCRDSFAHGVWDGASEYPICNCVCELHWGMNEDGECVSCDDLCRARGDHVVYDRAEADSDVCPCTCELGHEKGRGGECEKARCPDHAVNMADLQDPSSPVSMECPADRKLDKHCWCEPGYLRSGSECVKEDEGPVQYILRPAYTNEVLPDQTLAFSVDQVRHGRTSPVGNDRIRWSVLDHTSPNPYLQMQRAENHIGSIDANGLFTAHKIGTCRVRATIDGKAKEEGEVTVACPSPPAGNLQEIVRLFRQRIPEGPYHADKQAGQLSGLLGAMVPGKATNLKSLTDDLYKPFTCGGYQGMVLKFLHDLQSNPAECSLLSGYEFGPIQGAYGGHHAVVVYPKGSDWKRTGLVLDPWPHQRPEQFSIEIWAGTFSQIAGDTMSNYRLEYPTTKDPRDHAVSSLQVWSAVNDLINFFSGSLDCPADLLITDVQGRRLGRTAAGETISEIPNSSVMDLAAFAGEPSWYFVLDPRAGPFRLEVTGTGEGTFELVSYNPGDRRLRDYGPQPISQGVGAVLYLDEGQPAGALEMADGSEAQAVVLDVVQRPVSAWAVAFIAAGALGLVGLGVLLVGWRVAHRRHPVQAEAPAVAPAAESARTATLAGVPAWGALWVRQEGSPVQVFELREATVTIGRGSESGLRLEDVLLSRRHAELRQEGGAAVLYDLGSTNGTWVNRAWLAGPRRLSPGDVIQVGRTELVYRSFARAAAAGGRLMLGQGRSEPAVVDLSIRREVFIGRSGSCDVVIQGDPHVSRRHAQVQRTAGGHEILDLQSTSGVLVNGRPVARAHLRPGDRILLGATEFTYEKGGRY